MSRVGEAEYLVALARLEAAPEVVHGPAAHAAHRAWVVRGGGLEVAAVGVAGE